MGSHCSKIRSKRSSTKHSHNFKTSAKNISNHSTPFVPEKGFYQPSTEETLEAYQSLLSIIEHQLRVRSDQYVSCVAAEEILSVMKSVANPITQKAEIEKVLNPISQETFNQILLSTRLITDYSRTGAPIEKGFYQPRSEDTWSAYRLLLKVMESKIGLPRSLTMRCQEAHQILSILKNKNMDVYTKMNEIENYLGSISHETFQSLLSYAGLLWDFDDFQNHVRVVDVAKTETAPCDDSCSSDSCEEYVD